MTYFSVCVMCRIVAERDLWDIEVHVWLYHVLSFFGLKKCATRYSGDPKPETYFMAEECAVSHKL